MTIKKEFEKDKNIEYAELNYIIKTCTDPNDSLFTEQWSHDINHLQSSLAWNITKGSSNVIISIVDTGVDWEHPDLKDNIWINPGEDIDHDRVVGDFGSTASGGDENGIDDDGNGRVDDLIGWDYWRYDNNPQHGVFSSDSNYAHGTKVAGIASAVTNNNIGVAGICWNVKLMPLRAGTGRRLDLYSAVNGINYSVNNGAQIINCSWVCNGYGPLQSAISNAISNNVVVVGSAGTIQQPTYIYPAAYPDVLAVAALNQNDTKWFSSLYGTWVDVSAPGGGNWTTTFKEDSLLHTYWQGTATSIAAPHVSGLAALLLSYDSTLTNDIISNIIINSTDDIDPVNPSYSGLLGSGRINSYKALKYTLENYGGTIGGIGETVTFDETITINSTKTLTIRPGTTVKFSPGKSITINGNLVAEGTSANPILFTRNGASGNWNYIKFNSSGHGTISNAKIQYAKKGIYNRSDAVTIEDCIIEHFTEQGIYSYCGDINVEDCIIRNPNGASYGICLKFCNPTISGTEVYDISGIGVYDYFSNIATFSGGRIEDCSTGFKTYYSNMEIYNNYFEDNTYGIRLGTNSDDVNIHDNDFIYNNYGLYLEQSEPNQVKWNQFGYSITWKGNMYAGILVNFSYGSGDNYLDEKYNNFYDGDLWAKDIINNTDITINAETNYWANAWTTGEIDRTPAQYTPNSNAGPGGSLGKKVAEDITNKDVLPTKFKLEQNFPNPFNPSTEIKFHLPKESNVTLTIYNILGQVIKILAFNSNYQAGIHTFTWNATNESGNNLSAGIYYYTIKAVPKDGSQIFTDNRKLVYLK